MISFHRLIVIVMVPFSILTILLSPMIVTGLGEQVFNIRLDAITVPTSQREIESLLVREIGGCFFVFTACLPVL